MTCKHESAEWVFSHAVFSGGQEKTVWSLTCPDCGEVLESGFQAATYSADRKMYTLDDTGEPVVAPVKAPEATKVFTPVKAAP